MSKRCMKPRCYFPFISFIVEIFGIGAIVKVHEDTDTLTQEDIRILSLYAMIIAQFVLPDFQFFAMMATDSKNSIRPLGVVYNMYAFVMCLTASLLMFSSVMFCTPSTKNLFFVAAALAIVSASAHFGSIYEVGMRLPDTEHFNIKGGDA